ncbi:hypothetical protein D3C76_501470 [compost metagenome]
MIQKIDILRSDLREIVDFFLGQRRSFNPFAILEVTSVGSDFTNINFRIEVGGKRITVVACIRINNINRVDFVKIMLLRISCEHAGYAWVKAAAEQRGNSGLFESFLIRPLPGIFKFRGILRFVVGGIDIVHSRCQAGIHNGQVLIWESDINHDIRLEALDQFNYLVRVICIKLRRRNLRLASGQFIFQSITFREGSARYADLFKYIRVLAAFMNNNACYTASANN